MADEMVAQPGRITGGAQRDLRQFLQALVEADAPPLDEPVRDQDDDSVVRQVDFDRVAEVSETEEHTARLDESGRAALQEERRDMTGVGNDQRAPIGSHLKETHGGGLVRMALGEEDIETGKDVRRHVPLENVGPQRVAELGHDGGRRQRMALDVADGHHHVTRWELERVVEVATNQRMFARGAVPGVQVEAGDHGQAGR